MILLNYHEAADLRPGAAPERAFWTLPPAQIEAHLTLLRPHLITPEVFFARAPERPLAPGVLLTTDDGFESDYTYFFQRLMGEGRIPGFLSFVPSAFLGQPGRLSLAQLREMAAAGVRIGAHGAHHLDLTRLTPDALWAELTEAKARLEDHLGQGVEDLAFPFGRFSARVWRAARRAGYQRLYTIQLGAHAGFRPFLFSRLCMTRAMDAPYLARHLSDPDQARGRAYHLAQRFGLYPALMALRSGALWP